MTLPVTHDRIRSGISSTGGIARSFAAALARVEDAQLVAVGSRALDRARAFADEYGVDRAYGSLEALLADDDVDVVYIASPHSEHLREGRQQSSVMSWQHTLELMTVLDQARAAIGLEFALATT
jgi:hypothetical protein